MQCLLKTLSEPAGSLLQADSPNPGQQQLGLRLPECTSLLQYMPAKPGPLQANGSGAG